MESTGAHGSKNWYDKSYKLLLLVPALILLFSFLYLFIFYQTNGDFIHKAVSLTGGTTITVFDSHINIDQITQELAKSFPDVLVRGISDIGTGTQRGVIIETQADVPTIQLVLEKYLGYKLTSDNSSIEFSGATLSQGFYTQLIDAIIAAFLLMALVVFIIFSNSWKMKSVAVMITSFAVTLSINEVTWLKALAVIAIVCGFFVVLFSKGNKRRDNILLISLTLIGLIILFTYSSRIFIIPAAILLMILYVYSSLPSFAVILAAFADIVMTLAIVDLFGMNISGAGIIAFLMLIGYSVDTDILLTSRLLINKEGSVNHRIYGAFKTGITMTLTAIAAVAVSLIIIYNLSDTLRQIFTIILIGLIFDIVNTWITNASMLKWYMEIKKIQ